MFNLLATAKSTNYIVDIIAVLVVLIATMICAKKGLIDCFFGLVSSTLSMVIAVSFAKVFAEMTGGLFGLEGLLQGKMETAFLKINGFGADVSQSGVEAAIQQQNIPAIFAGLIMKVVGTQTSFPEGTTIALLLSDALSGIAVMLASGFILFILVKIGARFLEGILTGIAKKIKLIHSVDVLLGGVVGFVEGVLIVCVILAFFALFPNEAVTEYLSNAALVSKLYANNPLVQILAAML